MKIKIHGQNRYVQQQPTFRLPVNSNFKHPDAEIESKRNKIKIVPKPIDKEKLRKEILGNENNINSTSSGKSFNLRNWILRTQS